MYRSGKGKFPVCCQRSMSASISGVHNKSAFSGVAARSSCTGISIYGQRQLCFVQFRLRCCQFWNLFKSQDDLVSIDIPLRKVLIATDVSTFTGFTTLSRFGMTISSSVNDHKGVSRIVYLTSYEGVHLQVRPFWIRLWENKKLKKKWVNNWRRRLERVKANVETGSKGKVNGIYRKIESLNVALKRQQRGVTRGDLKGLRGCRIYVSYTVLQASVMVRLQEPAWFNVFLNYKTIRSRGAAAERNVTVFWCRGELGQTWSSK